MQVEPFHRGMHRGNDQQVVSRHFAERHRTGQRAEQNDPFGIDRLPDRPDDPAELAGIVNPVSVKNSVSFPFLSILKV